MFPEIKLAARICLLFFAILILCSCKDKEKIYNPTTSHIATPSKTEYIQRTSAVTSPFSTIKQNEKDENDFSLEGKVRKLFIEGI